MNATPEDGDRALTVERPRRSRLVPSAVTPVRASDLLSAWRRRDGGRDRFERAVASYVGTGDVDTYATYRWGLFDTLRSLGGDADDRTDVLVPAYSAPDFDAAIEAAGFDVAYCDVDPETLAVDVDSVRERISEDTLALFAVNLLGFGSRMDELSACCAAADVRLIEVLGYSLGTEFRGRRLGTYGDAAVINFQEGKPIPVGGGAVAWSRDGVAPRGDDRDPATPNYVALCGYSLFARPRPYALYQGLTTVLERLGGDPDRFTTHAAAKDDVEFEPPFEAMSDFQGALAHRLLARLESHRRRRARTARFYVDALAGCDRVGLVRPARGVERVQYVRYPIVVDDVALRDDLQEALRRAGVQTAALYSGREFDADRFPGAARLRRGVLTLPTHPYVSTADRRRIVDVVRSVVAGRRR